MQKTAIISGCKNYRYSLTRQWDESKPSVLFIGLNPSTADAKIDDPTLRRCINFAKAWGYGKVMIGNLFAYRATDPKDMMKASKPIGPRNNSNLLKLAREADLIVAAWGNHGQLMNRSSQVISMLDNLHILALNSSGEPKHPLYVKACTKPTQWR